MDEDHYRRTPDREGNACFGITVAIVLSLAVVGLAYLIATIVSWAVGALW